eukprot:TRINITY_DN214_c0_g1_i1.p1 TRINITY_DN214_c0_g1~~TRINITY_DN214_c0_g1_i1.p1  ORF type:complete len:108 (+),score=27.16 TRINITY_DN214_c0_g1_i1:59-382(+)
MDYIGFAYSAAVALGGIMGFVKRGSIPSMAAGVVFGGAAAFGAYQFSESHKSYHVALGVSSTLLGVMGYRFVNSQKFMPAGLIAGLSLLMVVRYGLHASGTLGTKTA